MRPHPERAFFRAYWPRGIYSFLELRRIARELKNCARRAGGGLVDYRTALACIATSAHDWLPEPSRVDPATAALFAMGFEEPEARPVEIRDQLNRLAAALLAMARVGQLCLRAHLHLELAAHQHTVAIPTWLTELEKSGLLKDLAKVAEAAANDVEVRKGQTKNKDVNSFLDQLVWQVEEFTGWRPTVSKRERSEDPYGGAFIALAAACLEPRGIRMGNHALGGAIERALKGRPPIHK